MFHLDSLMRHILLFIFFAVSLTFQVLPYTLSAEEKTLTEKEEALQRGVRFYRTKDYQSALNEFQKIEAKDPNDFLTKRYIAYLYYLLRDWNQAALKLNEALNLKNDDLLLRGLLADIYFKQANFDKSYEQYQYLYKNGTEEKLRQKAEKRLAEIEELKKVFTASAEGRMSISEFMNSKPAQDFSKEKFEEAAAGFDELIKQYPEDLLIRRFKGMALIRLQRIDEAIKTFQEILQRNPAHVATHFHLAQAYLAKGETDKARKEFQWVIAHDQTDYRTRAEYALFRAFGIRPGPKKKPWAVKLASGYDFDTNSILRSNDPEHRVSGDINSGRYPLLFSGTYRFLQNKKWVITGDSLYAQTLYHDFPNLNIYTISTGVSALYQFSAFHRPSFLNFREGASVIYLKNKLYLGSNSLSGSFITNLTPRWRATVSYRWIVNEFEGNGLDPDRTSRDGFASQVSVLNNFYLNTKRDHYILAGYDFERQDTSGANYIRNVEGGQIGYHFPFFAKTEGEVHFRFKDLNYNQFAGTPPKRRDDIYTLTVTLSKQLTSYLELTGSYVFEDSRAKNNTYEYTRQIFSVKATASY